MYLGVNELGIETIEEIKILKEPQQEETNLETESECLLQAVPMELWALSSMDLGRLS